MENLGLPPLSINHFWPKQTCDLSASSIHRWRNLDLHQVKMLTSDKALSRESSRMRKRVESQTHLASLSSNLPISSSLQSME